MRKKRNKLSKKKKIIIVVSIILVVLIGSGAGFMINRNRNRIEVTLAPVTRGDVQQIYETTATIKAASESIFYTLEGVKVKDVNVNVGDMVESGDVLATFDVAALNSKLEEKRSAYASAKETYDGVVASAKEAREALPELESEIARIEADLAKQGQEESTTEEPVNQPEPESKDESIIVSKLTSIFGESQLVDLISNMLNSGESISKINELISNLNNLGNINESDFGSFFGNNFGSLDEQSQLVQLKMQKTLYEAQMSDVYINAFKVSSESAYKEYIEFQQLVETFKNGWIASGFGKVAEINIYPGQVITSSSSSSSSSLNLNSIIGALSGQGDITSILTALMGSNSMPNKGMVVENFDKFIADFTLGMYDTTSVKLGQKAVVSYVGKEYEGEVSFIGATASESEGLDISSVVSSFTGGAGSSGSGVKAQVTIKNPDESLISGFSAGIEIGTDFAQDVLTIPVETLRIIEGEKFVYVYNSKDKAVELRQIEVGFSEDTKYEVVSGLSEGEMVIRTFTSTSSAMTDGVKVKVVDSK